MGLFDSFKKKEVLSFSDDAQALIALMVAVGSLDGELDEDELQALVAIASINSSVLGDELKSSFEFAGKYVLANGAEQSAVDVFGFLTDDLHMTAFSFACLVAMADGIITAEEEQTLIELAGISCLSEDESGSVIATCTSIMKSF